MSTEGNDCPVILIRRCLTNLIKYLNFLRHLIKIYPVLKILYIILNQDNLYLKNEQIETLF